MTLLEGLGYSEGPCAHVLSVAGLLALLALFPGWEGLFSGVKEASFLLQDPLTLNLTDRSVIHACSINVCTPGSREAGAQGGCVHLPTMVESIYTGWCTPPYIHPGIPGGVLGGSWASRSFGSFTVLGMIVPQRGTRRPWASGKEKRVKQWLFPVS